MSTQPPQPLPVDTDGDGLSDRDERWYRTDPTGKDTDFVGLSDEAEVRLGPIHCSGTPTSTDTVMALRLPCARIRRGARSAPACNSSTTTRAKC
jgi:Bacterial TSP3 repeat